MPGDCLAPGARLRRQRGKTIPKSKIEAMPRIAETYVFRDAQYFISHSTQNVSEDSSLVVLFMRTARPLLQGDPGGMTLAFAHGETDLLVRGEAGKVKPARQIFAFRSGPA